MTFGIEEVDVDTLWLGVILLLLFGMVALAALLLHHAGLFSRLVVKTCRPAYGEMVLMFKVGRGCYSGCGPLFTETHSLLPQYNCVGVYYDDPSKKPKEGLRYLVGAVLSSDGSPINEEDKQTFLSHGYSMMVLPAVEHAVCCDYPFTGTLSCLASVFRVYPVMREYIAERELCAHPFLEVYDGAAGLIRFIAPLEQQPAFYAPEVLADEAALTDPPSCESSGEESERLEESSCARSETGTKESSTREDSFLTESNNSVRDDSALKESGAEKERGAQHDTEKADSVVESKCYEDDVRSSKDTSNVTKDDSNVKNGSGDESETNTASSFEELEIPSSPLDLSPPSSTPSPPLEPLAPSSLEEEEENKSKE